MSLSIVEIPFISITIYPFFHSVAIFAVMRPVTCVGGVLLFVDVCSKTVSLVLLESTYVSIPIGMNYSAIVISLIK